MNNCITHFSASFNTAIRGLYGLIETISNAVGDSKPEDKQVEQNAPNAPSAGQPAIEDLYKTFLPIASNFIFEW